VRVDAAGRRVFIDADTHHTANLQIGDRHEFDGRLQEWTGTAWTAVCSTCDTPMASHDAVGWLCCGTCGLRAVGR
jgi:hypothetical protein